MKVIALTSSLLCLASCTRTSLWSLHQIKAAERDFDSSRLTYHTDKTNAIDLEFLAVKNQLFTYLQVHAHPLKDKEVSVTLIVAGEKTFFAAYPHQGGQRLSITKEFQEKIISLLKANQRFSLEVCGYQTEIHPQKFLELFKKLEEGPSFLNAIQLS